MDISKKMNSAFLQRYSFLLLLLESHYILLSNGVSDKWSQLGREIVNAPKEFIGRDLLHKIILVPQAGNYV